jgi:hypothetical protein
MNKTGKSVQPILAALTLALITSCGNSKSVGPNIPTTPVTPPSNEQTACDCSTFPPKKGCDTQCGITTGIVESVSSNSVVIREPSIKISKAGGAESAQIQERTFSVSNAEASQLQPIKPGSRVALTFQKSDNAVLSIRELPQ